jgi:MFS family permease
MLPIMAATWGVAFSGSLDGATVPLFVEQVCVEGADAADRAREAYGPASRLMAVQGVGAILGALTAGWGMGRLRPGGFMAALALGAAAATGLTSMGAGLADLMLCRAFVGFFGAALMSSTVILLGRAARPETRGAVFGWAVTARAVGWMLAPLISAAVAKAGGGLEPVFWAGAAAYAAVALFMPALARKSSTPYGPAC